MGRNLYTAGNVIVRIGLYLESYNKKWSRSEEYSRLGKLYEQGWRILEENTSKLDAEGIYLYNKETTVNVSNIEKIIQHCIKCYSELSPGDRYNKFHEKLVEDGYIIVEVENYCEQQGLL